MRNPHEVLREKEADLARVRHEVEALRRVAALLFEPHDSLSDLPGCLWPTSPSKNRWPLEMDDQPRIAGGL